MPDLTLKELSRLTRKHPVTLRRLAQQGKLPGAYRIGSRWMFRQEAIPALRGIHTKEKTEANDCKLK